MSLKNRILSESTNIQGITLTDFKPIVKEAFEFKFELFDRMYDEILNCDSFQSLHKIALSHIYPIIEKVENSEISIIEGLKEVLIHFGTYDLDRQLNGTNQEPLSEEEETLMIKNTFNETVLDYDEVPLLKLRSIKSNVEVDLRKIIRLIKVYEKDKFIHDVIEQGISPRNHDEKIKYDFYKRLVSEQQSILSYYLFEAPSVALKISRSKKWKFSSLDELYTEALMYPYEFKFYPNAFDHSKIDKSSHRLWDFELRKTAIFRALYQKDKSTFYTNFFEHKTPRLIFKEIHERLKELPIQSGRLIVFEKLENLFMQEDWLSFFALSLPQIEGLFSEILESIESKNIQRKALPDKVKFIGKYISQNKYIFDYFQYELPKIRNRFSHFGLTENEDLNSYDLLTDLSFLLKSFTELQNPFIRLNAFLKKDTITSITDIDDLCILFKDYEELSQTQLNKLESEFKEFCKKKLFLTNVLKQVIEGSTDNYHKKLIELKQKITESYFELSDFEDLYNTPKHHKFESTLNSSEFKSKLNAFNSVYENEIRDLIYYNSLLKAVKKIFKGTEEIESLKEIIQKHSETEPYFNKFKTFITLKNDI